MKHLTLSSMVAGLLILQVSIGTAQVGINTTSPRTTLEVGGSTLISDDLEIGIIKSMNDFDASTFLIQDIDNKIRALDVSNPTGAALGYIQEYVIVNANLDWVLNFDTQIDANDFDLISISAYYDTELALTSNLDKFSMPYTAAFVQNGTWRIIADFPAAQNLNTNQVGTWIITTLIFSKDLSKQLGVIEVPMNNQSINSAVTPIID
ncbi:MAG: hypothetical protein NXH73_01500 [Flavobacteriaceae bacterium]|nr:hypothetical protein [Flavobacteriaceae bacterium]